MPTPATPPSTQHAPEQSGGFNGGKSIIGALIGAVLGAIFGGLPGALIGGLLGGGVGGFSSELGSLWDGLKDKIGLGDKKAATPQPSQGPQQQQAVGAQPVNYPLEQHVNVRPLDSPIVAGQEHVGIHRY